CPRRELERDRAGNGGHLRRRRNHLLMRVLLLALAVATLSLVTPRAEAQIPDRAGAPASRVCTLRVDPGGLTRREGTVINILDPFRLTCSDGANLRASRGSFD